MKHQGSSNDFYADHILNIAHRGASDAAPENTLPAFLLAAELGADGIELDVQLSKDGEVVIIHDFSVDKTTDGRGAVKDMTLVELKALDAGRHFSSQFAGTPIPTLSELFVMMGPVLLYNIELKTKSLKDQGLEAEVIRLIEDHQLEARTILSSFNPSALKRAHQINPKIKRALLWAPKLPLPKQLLRSVSKPHMFHPQWETVTPEMVKREHSRNILVNVWTCNDPEGMRRLIAMGVDAIMTDKPDLLKQILDDTKSA